MRGAGQSDQASGANAPKYVAAKHFFKYIRPGAFRVNTDIVGSNELLSSAFVHDADGTMTIVLVNTSATAKTAMVNLLHAASHPLSFSTYTSSNGDYWQQSTAPVSGNALTVTTPGYGVVTLYGTGYTSSTSESADAGFTLYQNTPNPFLDRTTIRYRLDRRLPVRLTVQDLSGKTVAVLVDAMQGAGEYAVDFSAAGLPAGVYSCSLEVAGRKVGRKMEVGR